MFWWIPISMSTTYNQCQGENLNHSGTVLGKLEAGEVAVGDVVTGEIVLGDVALGK